MTTAAPVHDAGPPPAPRRSDRFFAWVAGFGIERSDGWIGGVAGGIAARLGIDPVIVRGILFVATLFALPAPFLYALAWAVLPDAEGRIHLRALLRGRFDPALLGIVAVLVLGAAPLWAFVPALFLGIPFSNPFSTGWPAIAALVTVIGVVIVAVLLLLIVRAARRTPGRAPDRVASAAAAGPDSAVDGSGPATAEGGAPVASPSPSDGVDDLEQWRVQHAAWKEQEQAWRHEQQDAERVARARARAERREQSAVYTAAAAENRRIRRLTSPRTSAAFIAVVVGIGIVAAAVTALLGSQEFVIAAGLFTAALVTGVGMIVAGVARRRSGFLAFVTVLLLASSGVATVVPVAQSLNVWGYHLTTIDRSAHFPATAPLRQPWGDLYVTVEDTGERGEWYIDKRTGMAWISVAPGATVDLDLTSREGAAFVVLSDTDTEYRNLSDEPSITTTRLADGRIRYQGTISGAAAHPDGTRQRIVLDSESANIEVRLWPPDEDAEPDLAPVPEPSATYSGGAGNG